MQANYSPASTMSKSHLVREVFERSGRYLEGRRYDIIIRAETVADMAASLEFERILDIGCGDGSISLPLLRPGRHLTLLDFSSNMTAIARSSVPRHLAASIEVRNEDFTTAIFMEHSFDLIICMGVMAHVDCPDQLIQKIKRLLRPGGTVILEFTDAYHPASWLGRSVNAIKRLAAPPKYPVNLFSYNRVRAHLGKYNLRPSSLFRYALPRYFWLERVVSQEFRYRIVRNIFGDYKRNLNRFLGNEYICIVTAEGTET
jgi:ubiquinone/menaquinone biosynthesis C-methylase UbiE